ncbi:hypothetical protein LguiA_006578 [Lonicera macranthoides]
MSTASGSPLLKISRANIVKGKFPRYFKSGNLVQITSAKLRSSSSIGGGEDDCHTRRRHSPVKIGSTRAQLTNSDMADHLQDSNIDRIARISSAIRVIPDFPKPGIMFQDITTLLLDPKAFKDTIDLFVERYKDKNISVVAGIEARGFIFGPPIALAIGAKFVPMRKPKKLPGEVISEEYSLEYGTDIMEMHVGAVSAGERALVIDDLIATGGTLCAAIRLLERVGVNVVECACVIELADLKGRNRLGDKPLFVLVS